MRDPNTLIPLMPEKSRGAKSLGLCYLLPRGKYPKVGGRAS